MYEKQDRNASPSSNGADASPVHPLVENNVMDTSKPKGGDHHGEVEEEEEEAAKGARLTYDEEYEDEDKHEEEEIEEEEEEEEEVVEEVKEEKRDPSDTESGATKKERSPPETSSVSNIEAIDIAKDGDYLEDLPTNQDDNTYYYYDDYENGNRSRIAAGGGFRSFLITVIMFISLLVEAQLINHIAILIPLIWCFIKDLRSFLI